MVERKICELPDGYTPSVNEEFMCDSQLEYFRRKLVEWRSELLSVGNDVLESLRDEGKSSTDIADRASVEADMSYELRSKERARKVVTKIDAALVRIQNKNYGYCEETGEPISLQRLEARPIAVLSIEAQERHERQESTHRDDEE